ncbi:hypothetical protein ACRRTK_002568 [Alexandromys fortis]
MVKFLLLALAFGLARVHAEIDGKWVTVAIAADNVKKIEEGRPLRAYLRELNCKESCDRLELTFYFKKCWRERECCNGGPSLRTEASEGAYNGCFGGPGESTEAASRKYIKKSNWKGTPVFQPACSAIIYTRYHTASAFTRATDLPAPRGTMTRVVILSVSEGTNT